MGARRTEAETEAEERARWHRGAVATACSDVWFGFVVEHLTTSPVTYVFSQARSTNAHGTTSARRANGQRQEGCPGFPASAQDCTGLHCTARRAGGAWGHS